VGRRAESLSLCDHLEVPRGEKGERGEHIRHEKQEKSDSEKTNESYSTDSRAKRNLSRAEIVPVSTAKPWLEGNHREIGDLKSSPSYEKRRGLSKKRKRGEGKRKQSPDENKKRCARD